MFDFHKKHIYLSLGQLGEHAAAVYLKKNNYKIICTNFFNPSGKRIGEIDIIAKDGNEYVFIEVKTRNSPSDGTDLIPEENINGRKLYKLKKISNYYIKKNNLWDFSYRFDALSIIYHKETEIFKIKHIKNIFL